MTRSSGEKLVELDPELERTLRRIAKERIADSHSGSVAINMEDINDEPRTLNDFARPTNDGTQSSIVRPPISVNNFELKPAFIQMVQNSCSFHGLPDEDPSQHIENFLEVCDMLKINGVTDDAIRLRVFPFTVKGRAKEWLQGLPSGSITTWDQLAKNFLTRYFPPGKITKLRQDITSFSQNDGESFYEARERFKDLLRRCPQHGIPDWLEVQTFYQGLNVNVRQSIDSAAGGAIGDKTPDEARKLMENMAMNSYQWSSRGKQPKAAGIFEVDKVTALDAKLTLLTKKFDELLAPPRGEVALICEICSGGHSSNECAIVSTSAAPPEQVDFVGGPNRPQGNPYSNTYNSGWRNHPNFSWSGQQQQQQQPRPNQPSGYGEKSPNANDVLTRFMSTTEAKFLQQDRRMDTFDSTLQNVQSSLHNIETQLGQISRTLSERQPGSLPSDTVVNPREHVKAITLRSGKEIESRSEQQTPAEPEDESAKTPEVESVGKPVVREYQPRIPYPARIKQAERDHQFKKFLELFKQLHINIPFVEALAQMPKYAKFLKDLLTNKKKLGEMSTGTLDAECSAILQNKIPKKLKDPGSFIIPCVIGEGMEENALADLGASVNVMSYRTYQKLELGEPTPTQMTIQLADRSVRHPRGVVEDVLVKVDKFIFPVDFVILDIDEDAAVPLILGRPFLATSQALIDVKNHEMKLQVGDEEVIFKLRQVMRHPTTEDDACFSMDAMDDLIIEHVQECIIEGPLKKLLGENDGEKAEVVNALEAKPPDPYLPKLNTTKSRKVWRPCSNNIEETNLHEPHIHAPPMGLNSLEYPEFTKFHIKRTKKTSFDPP